MEDFVSEVYEDVAAKDYVPTVADDACSRFARHIRLKEFDHFPHARGEFILALVGLTEVSIHNGGRHLAKRVRGVNAFLGNGKNASDDVGSENLGVPSLKRRQRLEASYSDGVRLFAGGAAGTPDPNRLGAGLISLKKLGQYAPVEGVKVRLVSEKRRFADGYKTKQLLKFLVSLFMEAKEVVVLP